MCSLHTARQLLPHELELHSWNAVSQNSSKIFLEDTSCAHTARFLSEKCLNSFLVVMWWVQKPVSEINKPFVQVMWVQSLNNGHNWSSFVAFFLMYLNFQSLLRDVVVILLVFVSKSSFIQLPFLKHITFFFSSPFCSRMIQSIQFCYSFHGCISCCKIMPSGNLHRNFLWHCSRTTRCIWCMHSACYVKVYQTITSISRGLTLLHSWIRLVILLGDAETVSFLLSACYFLQCLCIMCTPQCSSLSSSQVSLFAHWTPTVTIIVTISSSWFYHVALCLWQHVL